MMRCSKLWIAALFLVTMPLVACTNEEDLGGHSPASGATPNDGDASSPADDGSEEKNDSPPDDDQPGAPLTGTLGGKSFVVTSAVAHRNEVSGNLDLLFSDVDDLCGSLEQGKLPAGMTIVQLYGLQGTAPGSFTAQYNEIKYATLKASCPSGAAVDSYVEAASRVSGSVIEISSLTSSRVEGTLNLTFEDGSAASGSFTATSFCQTGEVEHATCL